MLIKLRVTLILFTPQCLYSDSPTDDCRVDDYLCLLYISVSGLLAANIKLSLIFQDNQPCIIHVVSGLGLLYVEYMVRFYQYFTMIFGLIACQGGEDGRNQGMQLCSCPMFGV